jgi:hypothetical protein
MLCFWPDSPSTGVLGLYSVASFVGDALIGQTFLSICLLLTNFGSRQVRGRLLPHVLSIGVELSRARCS